MAERISRSVGTRRVKANTNFSPVAGKHKSPSINQQLGCICNLCFDENKYFMFGCHAVVALGEVTYFWQELLIIGSAGPRMPW